MFKNFSNSLRFYLSISLVIFLVALFFYFNQDSEASNKITSLIENLGIFGPVGFIVVYGVSSIFFVSGLFMTLIGGALFGPFLGTVVNLSGASLGAAISFLISRNFGLKFVRLKSESRISKVKKGIDEEGWRFVAFVRLVPIFPFVFLNYAIGLTSISFKQYFITTIVCMIPASIAYTWVGHVGQLALEENDGLIKGIMIGLALLGALIFLPRFILKKRKNIAVKP